jgi:hypothetical protein
MLTTTTVDQKALERCMQLAMREPGRKQQLESKLQDEASDDVATFACYCVQSDNLVLKLWQEPPCWANEFEAHPRDKAAQHLLRQMLRAGLSRYEPDPMAALAKS